MSWIEECRAFAAAETRPLLEMLVAAPSINPPGNEALAADPLARFMVRHGVPHEVQETEPGRPNVIARAGGREPGRTLALCSHIDVVAPGDPVRWSDDPFTPRLEGDMLYGRGACDAKGSVAAMAVAVAFWHRHCPRRGTLSLAAVCGEERGGTGAKFLVGSGFRADGVIIGEPTNLTVQTGHKGRIAVTVRVRGSGGHASNPAAADNPILKLPRVIERLERLAAEISNRTHPLVGTGTLAITQVSTGDTNSATMPSVLTMTLDRRLLPGEEHAAAAGEIHAALAGIEGVDVDWFQGAYPYVIESDHPLVQACVAGVQDVTGDAGPIGGFPATCDQYVFGRAGLPTAIAGPGDLARNRTHAPDEFVSLAEVQQAVLVYAAIAAHFLEG